MNSDLELMLWALSHGWRVALLHEGADGALWRSPTRQRFLVTNAGPASDLPALSPELRGILAAARAEHATAAAPTSVPA
ncbi:MAG TPA: hypothetical protein VF665_18615 [Longimicrobium sp.]|uniref:hypothetical protein n=1 Tax=Longimicrobium sp. TaxID=2029185 RepID=UPI002ED826A9